MITQISDTTFSFTYLHFEPMSQYGDDPYLDNLGATSHLTPTYAVEDVDEYRWILDNNLPFDEQVISQTIRHIKFKNLEDAMAFKLGWL